MNNMNNMNDDLGNVTEREAKIVTFINMKGGVGKTTLCLSLGEFLAHHANMINKRNYKILFIDVDPQFNLTQSLLNEYDMEDGYLDKLYKDKDICKVFESKKTLDEKDSVPGTELIINLDESIHLIPGSIDLIFEDSKNDFSKTRKIEKFIDENKLKLEYDFIFIDCPPTITLYTDSALYASDYYVIPNKVDRYSILGVRLLEDVIRRLKEDTGSKIKPLGVVYTILDRDLTDKTKELMDIFEEEDEIRELYIFDGRTEYVKDLCVGYQGNIASKYKNSLKDIKILGNEFINRLSL